MKKLILLSGLLITACHTRTEKESTTNIPSTNQSQMKNGYAEVNGLRMYYEIYGQGSPLVLLHGGGSTIQTSFGRIIGDLAGHHQVIGIELQAHGRTGDRNSGISFEQDADDVAGLLNQLDIQRADILGFSNGGTTALQIGIRHPALVNRLIIASAVYKRSGAPAQFWDFMKNAHIGQMPQLLKETYKNVAPDPGHLQVMHDKCARRMVNFKDIPNEQIRSIKAPVFFVTADRDVVTPEHAVEAFRLLPNCSLAILPGGHGEYMGEITTLGPGYKNSRGFVDLVEKFLNDTLR